MRSSASGVLFLLLLLRLFLEPTAAAEGSEPSPAIEYVYIDANVGGSSGGHIALKLGQGIYHYQYFPDGLFRLVRDTWEHFRYLYNDLENRTIQLTRVAVSPRTYEQIQDRLIRLYLIQNSHLSVLVGLESDVRLLESLLDRERSLPLRGAGFFAAERTGDRRVGRLRARVLQRYGANFLNWEIRRIDRELSVGVATLPELSGIVVSRKQPSSLERSYSQRYLERRARREALAVLASARPLDEAAILDPLHAGLDPGEAKLAPAERRLLWAYLATLETAIVELVSSRRPDSGFPLLLALARYQVVQRSLETNRLLVLDPFSAEAVTIPGETVGRKRLLTEQLAARARASALKLRQEVFALDRLGEADYNRLENAAARYYEIQGGAVQRRAVRIERGRLIPSRPGPVFPISRENPDVLRAKLALARRNDAFYRREMREQYAFDLITQNCATELTRSINSAFTAETDRVAALGGRLQPGEDLTFIPFRLFAEVQARFNSAEVRALPSYRKRQLTQMYGQEDPLAVYLREFNTFSSSIYQRTDDDGAFLLFTDDIVLARPFYGVLNLAYGLVSAGVGMLTLPVEGARQLKAGLRGALFSLPELAFFNIRKGSFEFVENEAIEGDGQGLDLQQAALHRRVAP